MTAFIGRRLRAHAARASSRPRCSSHRRSARSRSCTSRRIFLVPLLLAPLGLAPVAAGAGDGAGLAALRRALTLCAARRLPPLARAVRDHGVVRGDPLPGVRHRALAARRARARDRDAGRLGRRGLADRGSDVALALRRVVGPSGRAPARDAEHVVYARGMSAIEEETAPRCANHPNVETLVSCSNCGKPICPDCMVHAPVGVKCRDCARMPRSALVRLKPAKAATAIAATAGAALAARRRARRAQRHRASASSASSSRSASAS